MVSSQEHFSLSLARSGQLALRPTQGCQRRRPDVWLSDLVAILRPAPIHSRSNKALRASSAMRGVGQLLERGRRQWPVIVLFPKDAWESQERYLQLGRGRSGPTPMRAQNSSWLLCRVTSVICRHSGSLATPCNLLQIVPADCVRARQSLPWNSTGPTHKQFCRGAARVCLLKKTSRFTAAHDARSPQEADGIAQSTWF